MKKICVGLCVFFFAAAATVLGAVTSEDIFDKTDFTADSKGGICVLIDCSAALVEDVFTNSNFRIYARFADRTQYDALLASGDSDVQNALFKELYPEYLPISDGKIPFPDKYANLLIVNNSDVSDAECERVVSPAYPYFNITSGIVPDKKTALYPEVISGNNLGDHNHVRMDDGIKHPLMSKWIYQAEFSGGEYSRALQLPMFYPSTLGYSFGETQVRSVFNGEILYDVTQKPDCVIEDKKWRKDAGAVKRHSAISGKYDGLSIPVSSELSVLGMRDNILYLYGTDAVEAVNLAAGEEGLLWNYTCPDPMRIAKGSPMCAVSDTAVFYVDVNNKVNAVGLDGVFIDRCDETLVVASRDKIVVQSNMVVFSLYWGRDFDLEVFKLEGSTLSRSAVCSDEDGIYAIGISKAGGIITEQKTIYDSDGSTVGSMRVKGCNGHAHFFNNSSSHQRGPVEDYVTGETYYKLGNKSACSTGGHPSNGQIFQSVNASCVCYFSYSIIGSHVSGGGDTGIDLNRVAPLDEKLFQETNYNAIASENQLPVDSYDWSIFKKDKAHSAYSPVVTKEVLDGSWEYSIPFARGNLTPAVTAGEYVFLGTEEGYLYALEVDDDAQTTTKVWEKRLPSEIRVSPTVWNSRLYVGCEDGMLYCYEAKTGRLLWRFLAGPKNRKIKFDDKMKSTWPVSSTVLIEEVNGTHYAFFVAGRLACDGTYAYKLNPLTGEEIWQRNIGVEQEDHPSKWSPPALDWKSAANATFISIAKGHLWVGGFRYNRLAGVHLDTGEKVRQAYVLQYKIDQRSVYTAFFRDYILYGGQDLYPQHDGSEEELRAGASRAICALKMQDDGFAVPQFSGVTNRLEPFGGNSLAWDDNYFFTGRHFFDADAIEDKLNETYEEGFVPEEIKGKGSVINWKDYSSLYMHSSQLYKKDQSPLITESAIIGGDDDSNLFIYKKETDTPELMEIPYGASMVQNGMVINRNGVLVLSTVSGVLKFIDVGDASGTAHTLTVVGGRGGKEYLEDAIVMIKADVIPGKRFTQWTGDTANVDDVNA